MPGTSTATEAALSRSPIASTTRSPCRSSSCSWTRCPPASSTAMRAATTRARAVSEAGAPADSAQSRTSRLARSLAHAGTPSSRPIEEGWARMVTSWTASDRPDHHRATATGSPVGGTAATGAGVRSAAHAASSGKSTGPDGSRTNWPTSASAAADAAWLAASAWSRAAARAGAGSPSDPKRAAPPVPVVGSLAWRARARTASSCACSACPASRPKERAESPSALCTSARHGPDLADGSGGATRCRPGPALRVLQAAAHRFQVQPQGRQATRDAGEGDHRPTQQRRVPRSHLGQPGIRRARHRRAAHQPAPSGSRRWVGIRPASAASSAR